MKSKQINPLAHLSSLVSVLCLFSISIQITKGSPGLSILADLRTFVWTTTGSEAIESLRLRLPVDDFERMIRMKNEIFDIYTCKDQEVGCRQLLEPIGREILLVKLAQFLRVELRILLLPEMFPSEESFKISLAERVLVPCKQVDRHLYYWWKKLTKSRTKLQLSLESSMSSQELDWIRIETICRSINLNSDHLKATVYIELERQLKELVGNLLADQTRFSNNIKVYLAQQLSAADFNRISLLRKCVQLKCRFGKLCGLDNSVPKEALSAGLAKLFKFQSHPNCSMPTIEEFEHKFSKQIIEPCKVVDRNLRDWWQEERSSLNLLEQDANWLLTENACKDIVENAMSISSSSLIGDTYKQLDTLCKQVKSERQHLSRTIEVSILNKI